MKKIAMIAAAAALTAGTLSADIQVNKYLSLGGFIDFTYQNVDVDQTAGTVASTDTSDFTMDQAEVDFKFDFGGGLSAQIDLQATANNDAMVEQAYLNYDWGNFDLTVGEFATVVGLEGLEPVDLYQYSHSLTFELEPSYHTGLYGNYENGIFNAGLGIVNSLSPANNADNNDELAVLVHLGLKPTEAWSMNLNYATADEANGTITSGAIPAGTSADTDLLTVDVSWSNYGWTVGAEYVASEVDMAGTANDTETKAWMLMANYAFTEQFALTGRYSTAEGKTGGDLSEISISPSYAFTPNWLGLIEYRAESGSATYTGQSTGFGGGKLDASVITLETILSF
jgi:hypothetical protein